MKNGGSFHGKMLVHQRVSTLGDTTIKNGIMVIYNGISWGYVANNADMIETWRKKIVRLWPAMNSPMDGLTVTVTCHRWAPSILGDSSFDPDTLKRSPKR